MNPTSCQYCGGEHSSLACPGRDVGTLGGVDVFVSDEMPDGAEPVEVSPRRFVVSRADFDRLLALPLVSR